jgi:hypothetical protein
MSAGKTEPNLRRIVTSQASQGSYVLAEGGPTAGFADLCDIWRASLAADAAFSPHDLGPQSVRLEPPLGGVVARWFTVDPQDEGMSNGEMRALAARTFERIGATNCHRDGPDPAMHQTASLDFVCLLSGSASLVLDAAETFLSPGDVVVQQGTAHAWRAYGGPALFFAVLIDRRSPCNPSSGVAS